MKNCEEEDEVTSWTIYDYIPKRVTSTSDVA